MSDLDLSWEDLSDDLGCDDAESGPSQDELATIVAKKRTRESHELDVRISKGQLFDQKQFAELAEAGDGWSIYVYLYDGHSAKPTLFVLQNIEYVKEKNAPKATILAIPGGQILANVVRFEADNKGGYIRTKLDRRVSVWSTPQGIWTVIEGAGQIIVPHWQEFDAFVVEHDGSLASIRTEVLIATGAAIEAHPKPIETLPTRRTLDPNNQNPSHRGEGNQPIAAVNKEQAEGGFAPADHAQFAGDGEAKEEPASELKRAA